MMTNEKAIGLLEDIITNKISVHGGNEEAINMAIEALKKVAILNGNTLVIKVSEEDIDSIKRVMLDCNPWCRIFYEDNVSAKEIIYCKDCKHHFIYRCMDSIPREICDLNQTFYDANIDFCSLAEKRGNIE